MKQGLIYLFVFSILLAESISSQSAPSNFTSNKKADSIFFALKGQLEEATKGSNALLISQRHWKLGEFYRTTGVYSEALEQFNKALERVHHFEKDTLHVIVNNCIGKVHFSLSKFEIAKQYFEESEEIANLLGNTKGVAVSKGLLGACFEKQGKYPEALEYQKQSLSLFQELGDKAGVSMANENIGSIYEDLGEYDMAFRYFQKSFEYLHGKRIWQEANVLNNLGDVYRKQGDYPNALIYTGKAMQVAGAIQDNHQLESANKDLSKAYVLLGDFKQAHYYLSEAERYNREWLENQNTRQLNVLQTIYDTNKKEAQIQLLQEQNKVSSANQKLLWVALFAVAAILIVAFTYRGRKRQAKLKIQEYEQRILKAELERKAFEEENLQQQIQLKTAALSRYSLHLSQKNKILLDLSKTLKNIVSRRSMDASFKIKELAKEIDFNLQQEGEWDEFMNFFKEIHPDFIRKLSALSGSSLSPAEMRLGMLLRLNLSSKEIASILRVTPDSVRVARYRLRKKLPIDQKEELVNFMVDL